MTLTESVQKLFARLHRRKGNYQAAFKSPAGKIVLKDLARFCRAYRTCVIPENRDLTLILEGRREVWLRISQHLTLNPEELAVIYRAAVLDATGENDG